MAQEVIPPRDVVRMRGPSAVRAEAQRVQGDVQRDQPVLRHAKHEVRLKPGSGEYTKGKKQERTPAS